MVYTQGGSEKEKKPTTSHRCTHSLLNRVSEKCVGLLLSQGPRQQIIQQQLTFSSIVQRCTQKSKQMIHAEHQHERLQDRTQLAAEERPSSSTAAAGAASPNTHLQPGLEDVRRGRANHQVTHGFIFVQSDSWIKFTASVIRALS